jgi:hypothetical protein
MVMDVRFAQITVMSAADSRTPLSPRFMGGVLNENEVAAHRKQGVHPIRHHVAGRSPVHPDKAGRRRTRGRRGHSSGRQLMA